MSTYFRITAYHPQKDICAIFDSNGKYEKKWQFSSKLVQNGFKIIAVGDSDTFDDGDFPKISNDAKCFTLRACGQGRPIEDGNKITVNGKSYTIK